MAKLNRLRSGAGAASVTQEDLVGTEETRKGSSLPQVPRLEEVGVMRSIGRRSGPLGSDEESPYSELPSAWRGEPGPNWVIGEELRLQGSESGVRLCLTV